MIKRETRGRKIREKRMKMLQIKRRPYLAGVDLIEEKHKTLTFLEERETLQRNGFSYLPFGWHLRHSVSGFEHTLLDKTQSAGTDSVEHTVD